MFTAGRGGESLKLITRTTGARVICSKERGRSLEEKGPVTITGTRREVRQAKVKGRDSLCYVTLLLNIIEPLELCRRVGAIS